MKMVAFFACRAIVNNRRIEVKYEPVAYAGMKLSCNIVKYSWRRNRWYFAAWCRRGVASIEVVIAFGRGQHVAFLVLQLEFGETCAGRVVLRRSSVEVSTSINNNIGVNGDNVAPTR
jgi:hypothetical protein